MLTPDIIAAAISNPAALDIATLERVFDAFALFPAGEGLSGFDGPDHMLRVLTDGVCTHLIGDFNPLPTPVHDAVAQAVLSVGGWMPSGTYEGAAAAVIRHWPVFAERLAATFHPA